MNNKEKYERSKKFLEFFEDDKEREYYKMLKLWKMIYSEELKGLKRIAKREAVGVG